MRRAELCHLKVEDIDSNRMIIHIRHGKRNRDRDVPLSPKLLDTLREYWRWMQPKTYLFPGTKNGWRADKPITPKVLWEACREAAKAAGIMKDVPPHLLRHSFATQISAKTAAACARFISEHKPSSLERRWSFSLHWAYQYLRFLLLRAVRHPAHNVFDALRSLFLANAANNHDMNPSVSLALALLEPFLNPFVRAQLAATETNMREPWHPANFAGHQVADVRFGATQKAANFDDSQD